MGIWKFRIASPSFFPTPSLLDFFYGCGCSSYTYLLKAQRQVCLQHRIDSILVFWQADMLTCACVFITQTGILKQIPSRPSLHQTLTSWHLETLPPGTVWLVFPYCVAHFQTAPAERTGKHLPRRKHAEFVAEMVIGIRFCFLWVYNYGCNTAC